MFSFFVISSVLAGLPGGRTVEWPMTRPEGIAYS